MLVLRSESVSRRFGDHLAVHEASVELTPGRIHALVGENGAGKSTLLKLFAGAIAPTSGTIWVGGSPLVPVEPQEAIRRGVGMVYQHFSLVDAFTGLENLMLGAEPTNRWGVLQPALIEPSIRRIESLIGQDIPLHLPVVDLSVGQRQRLEIMRVLVRGARALLLDEPTAILVRQEVEQLYGFLQRAAKEGATVAVVTHHLQEVVSYADEVTVMRAGRVVHQGSARELSVAALATLALGSIPSRVESPSAVPCDGAPLLRLESLVTSSSVAAPLRGVTLELRPGEIVGVAGIDGNGQEDLVLALAGLKALQSGRIVIADTDISRADVTTRRALGLEVIFADRHRFGLILNATVHDNLILGDRGRGNETECAARRLGASGLVPADPRRVARELSGGNQQKLVLARALDRKPRVLIAAYPTRGVDAAAASMLRQRIAQAAMQGSAVLLLSAELEELRALAHRLMVLAQGRIVAELPVSVEEAALGHAMLAQAG